MCVSQRSYGLMWLFVAACGFFAVALSVESRIEVNLGGRDGTANSKPSPERFVRRETEASSQGCTNQASSRQCWGGGFDVGTDVDWSWPDTGRTVDVR